MIKYKFVSFLKVVIKSVKLFIGDKYDCVWQDISVNF